MKKTLSIFLIVTMLLSMFAMALPTFAAGETVDNTKTPGHADYDHVTKAEFAAALEIEESAVNVITNYADYCAISGGADANNIKYYLVILDGTEVLDLTQASTHIGKNHANLYIDFNGYSVKLGGVNNGMFMALYNATIKNLKIEGSYKYVSDRTYSGKMTNLGQSPLTTHGYGNGANGLSNGKNGVLHVDNVISTVNITVTQQHGGGKFVGGIVDYAAGGSTFNKCVFEGSIRLENDAIMATDSGYKAVRAEHTGGVVGHVEGAATFTNCTNKGTISIAETTPGPYNGDNGEWGGVYVGGIAGRTAGATLVENCTNEAPVINITDNTYRTYDYAGGIIGVVNGSAEFKNCSNTANMSSSLRVSGICSYVGGTLLATNCVNTGNITGLYAQGGLFGKVTNTGTFVDCVNGDENAINQKGNLVSTSTSGSGEDVGGIVGTMSTTGATFEGCVNYGSITTNGSRNKTAKHVGGIVGRAYGVITMGYDADDTSVAGKPCYNYGDITVGSIFNDDHASTIGGLAGTGYKGIKALGCVNYGNITMKDTNKVDSAGTHANTGIGGVVGAIGGTTLYFESCANMGNIAYVGTVRVNMSIGGIVGKTDGAGDNTVTLLNCSNAGNISNGRWTGGLVAYADSGKWVITNAVNTGTITSGIETSNGTNAVGYSMTAGIIAHPYKHLVVKDSRNAGEVVFAWDSTGSTVHYVGGIVAYTEATANISNTVNAGSVKATGTAETASYMGGFAGWFNGKATIMDCVNDAPIFATNNTKAKNKWHIGGIAGMAKFASDFDNVVNTSNGDIYAHVNASDMIGIGGMVGYQGSWNMADKFDFYRCSNLGDIVITGDGKNACLGGIAGRIVGQPGIIKNSANAGNIFANITSGSDNGQAGIVGLYQRATGNYTMDIINCVNIGEINGMHTGGIVGTTIYNEEARKLTVTIDNCLNAGVLNGTKTKDGIFARNNEPANTPTTITNCNGAATVDEAMVFATALGLSLTSSMPKALDLAIKGAETLFNSNEVYTDASWANFLAALNTAKVYQATTDLTKADPNEVNGYIELLANAKNALVLGGDIYTGADFAKLNGQKGTFNLMADITITAGVDSFAGVLNANGHTITVVDCALFGELNGAEINNLVVKGTATDALFGKAVGEIAIDYIYVDVAGDFAAAVLFDGADAEAEIEIKGAFVAADSAAKAAILAGDCDIELKTVVADVTAPALTTASEPEYDSAYLVGVEAYIDEEAIDLDDGAVAYAFTKAFVDANALASVKVDYSDVTLVQILGIDVYPEVAPFAVDGINVVAPIMEGSNIVGYKNAAIRYEDATPVLPVEPIAPIAPVVSGLQSSIAKAEALVEANYTADTWAAVKTALAVAKAALTADTQAAIDDARFALDLAVAGLKKVPAPAAPSVSLDAINAAIAAAEAKNAGEYTTATWSAVQAALSAAKSAKALGDQAAIDAATTALNAAVAALAKAPAPEAPVISKPAVTEPAAEEGCGGVIGGAAVVLTAVVALGAGVSFKKKED